MYNTALRILKDSFEAEDIMQESFLKAFSKLGTFKSESRFDDQNVPFGSWLKRIVINNSLTQLNKNKRLESWNTHNENIENLHIADHQESGINNTNIKVEEILKKIKKLKNNYSIVLTLSLIEGYDNDEIAQILKTNNQNVRTTISRAKKSLRKLLENKV
jgi:RNA polymerase sigma-70 factor (ECF subfamily)